MKTPSRALLALAALHGLIAVTVGAFATHGIGDLHAKDLLRTGSQYEMAHALAVFGAFVVSRTGAGLAGMAAWCFVVGAAMFSWSIYALALAPRHWMGPVTPLGGLLLMVGWAMLAVAALTAKREAAAG
jgi:uncharacterized membrane protein YgdD (TMEM256/DUF423 family)